MPRWEEFKEILMMDEVEIFATELTHLAQEYNIPSLIKYSSHLYEEAQSYNVDEVEKIIAQFPKHLVKIAKEGKT